MKKKKRFTVPGMYHPIPVELISQRFLNSKKDLSKETIAYYDYDEVKIYILETLTPFVMRHSLYHEISHHVKDELGKIKNEENACDILATHQMNLGRAYLRILKTLKKLKGKNEK
jgi:hypothetical protein